MSEEYFITGVLKLETAVHIGTGKNNEPTDSPLRRMGDGRYLLSGRSLGGSLRTLATRLAPRLKGYDACQILGKGNPVGSQGEKTPCGCPICRLFGDVIPVDGSRASRIWIYDTFAQVEKPTHVRDGVGIDRRTGAASKTVKFDYEVIPAGTTFDFRLRIVYEEGVDEKEIELQMQLLASALAEWEAGRGQIGGGTARGLGRFSFAQPLKYAQTAVTNAATLYQYLLADDPTAVSQPINDWPDKLITTARALRQPRTEEGRMQSIAASLLRIKFTLGFAEPFLSNDPLAALLTGFDHVPLVEFITKDGLQTPVLAGSSLRGVLRSHGEKIARTLATNHWYDKNDLEGSFNNFRVHCPACDVLVNDDKKALASCDKRLNLDETKETAEEMLCLSCQMFGSQRRGSRLWISDGHWLGEQPAWLAQDFLAIDRFTGGGLDGAKFDAAPLLNARFAVELILHDPLIWELGWLALLLRDLADGRMTIGFGAAKGYGQAKVGDVHWQVGYLHKADLMTDDTNIYPPTMATVQPSGLYDISNNQATVWLPAGWQDNAQTWVTAFNEAVTGYEVHQQLSPFQADTFFSADGRLAKLYGPSRAKVGDV